MQAHPLGLGHCNQLMWMPAAQHPVMKMESADQLLERLLVPPDQTAVELPADHPVDHPADHLAAAGISLVVASLASGSH